MTGTLFLVATPIGNLKDITQRALQTLQQVGLILAEDTRKSGLLLKHYDIQKPLLAYFEHNELRRIPEVIQKLKEGKNIALISNAGTPTISDPGYKLIRTCLSMGISVVSIPGPSAIISALISSGLPTDRFLFLGFLPRKEGQLKNLLEKLKEKSTDFPITFVAFESPYRLLKTLNTIKEVVPQAQVAVCRELTKIHEEVQHGSVEAVLTYFITHSPKGEITLVFRL